MPTLNRALGDQAPLWGLAIALLVSTSSGASQYLEVTAEIEINQWSSWFGSRAFSDLNGKHWKAARKDRAGPGTAFLAP